MESAALFWNAVALEADKVDHTGDPPRDAGGPVYSARALAMAHAAMADAYAAAPLGDGGAPPFAPFFTKAAPTGAALPAAALAGAAFTVLSAVYGKQQPFFDERLATFRAGLAGEDQAAVENGLGFGRTVAEAILGQRAGDGSQDPPNGNKSSLYPPGGLPGLHDLDPLNPDQGFYAWRYGNVAPFVLRRHEMLEALPPPPPRLHEPEYVDDYVEVNNKGRLEDALSIRTPEEKETGIFWAYDGVQKIGTPPRLYNQVIRAVGLSDGLRDDGQDDDKWLALLAQANLALADAGAVAWHAKYLYNVWRPVVGIRRHVPLPDRPDADRDETWVPLGAPASNMSNRPPGTPMGTPGRDFTPPFPAYPSGHATFGAAAFTVLREFRARHLPGGDPDAIDIHFMSDEFNGETTDAAGVERPEVTRHFTSIETMIMQNLESRVFLGVHWRFDGVHGRDSGAMVGQRVAERAYVLPPPAA